MALNEMALEFMSVGNSEVLMRKYRLKLEKDHGAKLTLTISERKYNERKYADSTARGSQYFKENPISEQ